VTPREWIMTIGLGCLGITFLIILFSFIGSPYELIERLIEAVKRRRLERATKEQKSREGRHHLNGPADSEDDSQVADHPSDDGTHKDDEKESA
jgi:hypothetical protein